MRLIETDHRVIRKDAQGNRFEYSDSQDRPFGDGWQRVNPVEHPRARVYMWFRPYSYVAKEYREKARKPSMVAPTDLKIDTGLLPKLGAGFEQELNTLRQKLRDTFEQAKQPFYTGDRVRIKGKEGIFYVKRVDDARGNIVLQDAADQERQIIKKWEDLEQDFEHAPVPWTKGDLVTVEGKAATGVSGYVDGMIIAFDNFTNKLRVQIGTKNTIEVYPEAVVGIRGKNPAILEHAAKFFEANPSSFSGKDSKLVLESLLRAALEGREQVKPDEIKEDIKATSGFDLGEGTIRGNLQALSSIFSSGQDHSLFFNPVTDALFMRDGQLAVRLVANARDIKNTHKGFGWKNITSENPDETYAEVGQTVWFMDTQKDTKSKVREKGKIRRIDGNRAEVYFGGTTRMFALSELQDMAGRRLLPDPTDPAAFGALNKNAFWLLRDREWCRDYKKGDVVSLLSSVEDIFGNKARGGGFARVVDTTTDGRLYIETSDGKKMSVSPRQTKQMRYVGSLKQMRDRIEYDPQTVYGSTTILQDPSGNEARIGVGGERSHRFLNVLFPSSESYLNMESTLFEGIVDDRATQNRTRMIMPMNSKQFEDRENLTLVPNESLFQILRKMYPNARRVLITRQAKVFPGARMNTRPAHDPVSQQYNKDEIAELVARGAKPAGEDYFDPHGVQRGARKKTKGEQKYYSPEGTVYDFEQTMGDGGAEFNQQTGEFALKGMSPKGPTSKYNGLLSYLNPFRGDSKSVGPTLTYSAADMDALQKHSPVTLRIVVDPSDAEINASNGVTHDVAVIARHYSPMKDRTRRPVGAFSNEGLNWDSRVRITADSTSMYVSVGKELLERPSVNFQSALGEPLTFHQLATMSMTDKYLAWEDKVDPKQFRMMVDLSSMFTYDSAHKRYRTSLANYKDAHKFLKMFFGESGYDQFALEDTDGAYSFSAAEHRLADKARDYQHAFINQHTAVSDQLPVQDLRGFNYGPMESDSLRDYQRRAVNFMLQNNHTLLAYDQGTGKTAAMLAAIRGRMNRGEVQKALVVCPASLVTTVWPGEIETWCKDKDLVAKVEELHTSGKISEVERNRRIAKIPTSMEYSLLTSKNKDGFFKTMLNARTPVVGVASYEMVNVYGKELQRLGFEFVGLDEAQNIKTGKTKTRGGSQRSATIKDIFTDVPYKVAATGTPIENSADDLHSIVTWLNPSLLGPAENFSQDFIETDFVVTPDGKRQAVNVAVKKPAELKNRLDTVMLRVSKDHLEGREQAAIKKHFTEAGKADKYNSFLHYGTISPRLVYPIVSVTPEGVLEVSKVGPDVPYEFKHTDGNLIKLDEIKKEYPEYVRAVREANAYLTSHYKGGVSQHDRRYGTVNIKASNMLQKMQQVLNDPSILGRDPEFKDNPLFNNPSMPNPKFDKLASLLDRHDRKPYFYKKDDLMYHPIPPESKDGTKHAPDFRKRERALSTRGKTVVFCETVEAMKNLKTRLEGHANGKYRGRILYYAGTENINELMGTSSNGKQTQQFVEKQFKENPNYDILVANRAAETGLSFPQADLVVNYELTWNPQGMNQRIDRAHRVGSQPRPVTAINIAVADTVEAQKLRAHVVKQQLFKEIITSGEEVTSAARTHYDLLKRKTLLGDDAAGLMDELINSDPTLKNIQAASEESIIKAKQVRSLSTAAMKAAAAAKKKPRGNVISRALARWW
jgi:SNF2 family DNA or RNA helicase